MAELTLNTARQIVIACAGTGSRMQVVNSDIHKALLPYNNAPILYSLISGLPGDLEILVLVGHLKEQIIDFLQIAFPNHNFRFINVVDFESPTAGTATSLRCAKPYLVSDFWYLPCDGLFEDGLHSIIKNHPEHDTIFVAPSNSVENPCEYTVVDFEHGKAKSLILKPNVVPYTSYSIFTGLAYIRDAKDFFDRLDRHGLAEFVPCLSQTIDVRSLDNWKDLGSPNEYRRHTFNANEFDFSKPHEITYILKERIVKYFLDRKEAELKVVKPSLNPLAYPAETATKGQFFSYRTVSGKTLYQVITPPVFLKLLNWLSTNLWHKSSMNMDLDLFDFYVKKSQARVSQITRLLPYNFSTEYTLSDDEHITPQVVLENVDWNIFTSNSVNGEIHGDLQFDNVILKHDLSFCLIDWRTSFGKQILLGDIYYDLAKLLGGIRMNYFKVKSGDFSFNCDGTLIKFTFPNCPDSDILETLLFEFATSNGYSVKKIEYLTALIFLNMAPMHNRPFADLLFFHSLSLLKRCNSEC